MSTPILLDLFILPGKYLVLNNFVCCNVHFFKNDVIEITNELRNNETKYWFRTTVSTFKTNICYVSKIYINKWKSPFITAFELHNNLEDEGNDNSPDLINKLIPNVIKLTKEELIIKNIIE